MNFTGFVKVHAGEATTAANKALKKIAAHRAAADEKKIIERQKKMDKIACRVCWLLNLFRASGQAAVPLVTREMAIASLDSSNGYQGFRGWRCLAGSAQEEVAKEILDMAQAVKGRNVPMFYVSSEAISLMAFGSRA